MIVAVTMRLAPASGYTEARDVVSHDWTCYLASLGVVPVYLPNVPEAAEERMQALGARGLLLTGGDNIGPLEGESGGPAPSLRDETERRLLAAALDGGLPIFGVCRGLQAINLYFGGTIQRRLPGGHVGDHEIWISRPVAEHGAGDRITVNSYHDQGVMTDGLARGMTAFAFGDDGLVEGLSHDELPVQAVQWHPERPDPAAELSAALIGEWLERCA